MAAGVLAGQVLLEGLVEPLDLAAGLRVVGPGVLGADAQGEQFEFEDAGHLVLMVRAEDQAVAGEEGFRVAPGGGGLVQGADHVRGPGGGKRPGGDAHPGVVIDDVEHLEHRPASPRDVGDVGLPALVGELGREPPVGAFGALVRLGGDEAPGPQHPPDGGHRWDSGVPAGQMDPDRLGPGVQARFQQLLAHGGDFLLPPPRDPCG